MSEPTKELEGNGTAASVLLDAGEKLAAKVEYVKVEIGRERMEVPCMVNPGGDCKPLTDVLAVAEKYAPAPHRRRGTAELQSLDSFIAPRRAVQVRRDGRVRRRCDTAN
jgi:hypothetical protein